MTLGNIASEVAQSEHAVIIFKPVFVDFGVLAWTLNPIDVFFACEPDHQVVVLPGLLGVDVDGALDDLAGHVVGFVEFHIDVDVLILVNWGAH